MSKILITGASGFVGSFLVEKALELGFDTWAVLRKTSSKEYLTDPRIHFIELDLGNDAVLTQQLSEHAAEHGAFDYVIHAAGATKAPNEAAFRRTNTEGTPPISAHPARVAVAQRTLCLRFLPLCRGSCGRKTHSPS